MNQPHLRRLKSLLAAYVAQWESDKRALAPRTRYDVASTQLATTFRSVGADRVQAATADFDLSAEKGYLHLPPVQVGLPTFLPVATVMWHFSPGELPELRFRVGLFHCDASGLSGTGLGFRYETPEGTGGGLHDYYHCQLITNWQKDGPPLLRGPCSGGGAGVFNVEQPAFPLHAEDPFQLMACALGSLYGPLDVLAVGNKDPYVGYELEKWRPSKPPSKLPG